MRNSEGLTEAVEQQYHLSFTGANTFNRIEFVDQLKLLLLDHLNTPALLTWSVSVDCQIACFGKLQKCLDIPPPVQLWKSSSPTLSGILNSTLKHAAQATVMFSVTHQCLLILMSAAVNLKCTVQYICKLLFSFYHICTCTDWYLFVSVFLWLQSTSNNLTLK